MVFGQHLLLHMLKEFKTFRNDEPWLSYYQLNIQLFLSFPCILLLLGDNSA